MAIKDKPRGYQKRMHQQWKDRGNLKCTEQWLCDQKKQIEDKESTNTCRIEEVKQQIKSDTFQEEDDQKAEEVQQTATTILEPVEPEVNPEPEDPIPPTNHETPDDDDDYEQLKDEYLELVEEFKSQPIKEERDYLSWKMTRTLREWLRPLTR